MLVTIHLKPNKTKKLIEERMKKKNPNRNILRRARQKRGLSQKQVAFLLNQKSTDNISHYENERYLPSLRTAMQLEIIYQMPIRLLFSEIYNELVRDVQELQRKFPSIPNSNTRPGTTPRARLHRDEACFYKDLLLIKRPTQSELENIDGHVINLSWVSAAYKRQNRTISI
jgi:transcriptional regulator with XRE-family HTH domain